MVKAPERTALILRLVTTNDRSGNPRRLLVIYHAQNTFRRHARTIREGYLGESGALQAAGYSERTADVQIEVTPSTWRKWNRHAESVG